jgi:hypothetical protein
VKVEPKTGPEFGTRHHMNSHIGEGSSMVLAMSNRVLFFLSTTPFC